MYLVGGGVDQFWQFVGVGVFEFGNVLVIYDYLWQWVVLQSQVLKYGFGGGWCVFGCFFNDWNFQFFVKNFVELFG